MVQRIFKVSRSSTSSTGWEIEDTSTDKVLNLPEECIETLNIGK